MSEQGWRGFLAAEGVEDWVVLQELGDARPLRRHAMHLDAPLRVAAAA